METQIQQLLQAITAMTTTMQQQQQQIAANQQTSSTNVNIISTFEAFDPKVEPFKTYKERLENHFHIRKIVGDKDMCAKLLLQYIGPATYSRLATLASPKNINVLKYDEIIALLEKHFCQQRTFW